MSRVNEDRGIWLQYVREVTRKLIKARLLKDLRSVNNVPVQYWKTTARASRPTQRDFVRAHAVTNSHIFGR